MIGRQTRGGKSKLQQMIGQQQVARVTDHTSATMFSVSMRHAFVPFKGKNCLNGLEAVVNCSGIQLRCINLPVRFFFHHVYKGE